MKWYRIKNLSTGEIHFDAAEDSDNAPDYGDEYEIILWPSEPTERDSLVQSFKEDISLAEIWALNKVEEDAEIVSDQAFSRLRRQIAVAMLWQELQRLKLANATGNFTGLSSLEKQKQFPIVMTFVSQTGATVTQVATALETRVQSRIQTMALAEVKLMLGKDSIRSAVSIEQKLDALDSIVWS